MAYSIDPVFVLKNQIFRKIALFDKKKILIILLLASFSTAVYTSFPLITQVYIQYLYNQQSIAFLLQVTLLFMVLFGVKLGVDVLVERYSAKYFLKIEKHLKEQIFLKYQADLKKAVQRSDLFTTHINLYALLIRTIYYTALNMIKIGVALVIIAGYDLNLLVYVLLALPFLFLFYLLSLRIEATRTALPKGSSKKKDFGLLLNDLAAQPPSAARQQIMAYLEQELQRKTRNKQQYSALHLGMDSFITFFRIAYLAYFGYYAISFNMHISGLIVGLLFITILLRPCIQLIQSAAVYRICSKSFFKINALFKDGTKP